MRRHSTLAMSLVFGAAAAACGPSDGGGGGGGSGDTPDAGGNGDTPDARGSGRVDAGPRVDGGPDEPPPAGAACTKMDIVFVVDNSNSMGEEQDNLERNFPEFARILDEYRVSTGEPLDYRVGVTTTARTVNTFNVDWFGNRRPNTVVRGEDGAFRQPSGVQRRWIESSDADRAQMLESMADVGIGGSHLEMPMDAARLALSERMASGQPNAGFVREDALLAIILLTDEEDCSRLDGTSDSNAFQFDPFIDDEEAVVCGQGRAAPQAYIDFFDQLKGDRKRWATAVIAGDGMGNRTCRSSFGNADDAPRLKEFVTKTGENAIFRSICQGDLAPALKDALDTFQAACEGLPPIDD